MLHRDICHLPLTACEMMQVNLPPGSLGVFQTR
jgi:hypothetical protein